MHLDNPRPDLLRCVKFLGLASAGVLFTVYASATEYHVAVTGDDGHTGTADQPFKTIQKAATVMQPGDICTVHAGTYREWVNPPRGGTSETARITYRAADGEAVYVSGAERITGWTKDGSVWKAVVPNTTFGTFNPYSTNISGDYLTSGGDRHLGEVYLNGEPYLEKLVATEVSSTPKTWRAVVDDTNTTIWANFPSDPNAGTAEINVRKFVFAPRKVSLAYITVDGFHLQQAATQWAPPTGPTSHPQEGLIMSNVGFKWIIQNNEISNARASCLAGGFGTSDTSHAVDKVGAHIVRNNWIHGCGQAGIVGDWNWETSLIESNLIEDIDPLQDFGGWEGGGIKAHSATDLVIRNNVIRSVRAPPGGGAYGIWLDWQNQGARITGNVIYKIDQDLISLEENHGPTLIDDNILIGNGGNGVSSSSDTTIYVHNLFVKAHLNDGTGDSRTPAFYTPHTSNQVGTPTVTGVDVKYFNNIFVDSGPGLQRLSGSGSDYGVYYGSGQKTSWGDAHSKVVAGFDAAVGVIDMPNGVKVSFKTDSAPTDVACPLINAAFIGQSSVVHQGIENHDGTGITIDHDMLGAARNTPHPTAGPIEGVKSMVTLTVTAGPQHAARGHRRLDGRGRR